MPRPRLPDIPRTQWVGLAALLLGALALGAWLRHGMPIGTDVSNRLAVSEIADAPGYPASGPRDADVTLLVFSDYDCPVCRATEPALDAAIKVDGRVRVIYRDWPIFGAASTRAAKIALAAHYQGLYRPVHDALMRAPSLDEGALRTAVKQAGGSWRQVQVDLVAHGPQIDGLIARSAEDAMRLGLPGTPGYLVGPIRIVGKASEKQFLAAIARARAS